MPSFWDRFRGSPKVNPTLTAGHTFFSVNDPPPANALERTQLTWTPTGAPVSGSIVQPDVYTGHVVGTAFFEQWTNQPTPGGGSARIVDSYPPNIRPESYYAPTHYRGLNWQLQRVGGGGVSRPPGLAFATEMYQRGLAVSQVAGPISSLFYSGSRSSDRSPNEASLIPGAV